MPTQLFDLFLFQLPHAFLYLCQFDSIWKFLLRTWFNFIENIIGAEHIHICSALLCNSLSSVPLLTVPALCSLLLYLIYQFFATPTQVLFGSCSTFHTQLLQPAHGFWLFLWTWSLFNSGLYASWVALRRTVSVMISALLYYAYCASFRTV